jgi:hypothetical protein
VGEDRDAAGNLDAAGVLVHRDLRRVVVETERRADRLRQPVDHDVRQQFILGEAAFDVAVAVAPGPKLFDDPRRQSDRRVVQRVGQGLRLRTLHQRVGALRGAPAVDVRKVRALLVGQLGRVELHEGQPDVGAMDGDDVLRVIKAEEARDGAAEIAARRAEAVEAEHAGHELVPQAGDPLHVHPRCAWLVRVAEAR